jgi:hypothetical protein
MPAKNRTQLIVVSLTWHEGEMRWQPIGVDHRVNLANKPLETATLLDTIANLHGHSINQAS